MSGAWASRGPSRTRASLEFSFGAYEEVEKAVPFPALLKHAVGSAPDHPAGAPTGLFQLSAILIPVHVFRDVRSRGSCAQRTDSPVRPDPEVCDAVPHVERRAIGHLYRDVDPPSECRWQLVHFRAQHFATREN